MSEGWIGVDLDGTLAHYDGWRGADHIGDPVQAILDMVFRQRLLGIEVRIFTARVYPLSFVRADDDMSLFVGANDRESEAGRAALHIHEWCDKHLGYRLPITCKKDYGMVELWDDRAIQVESNTGKRVDGK